MGLGLLLSTLVMMREEQKSTEGRREEGKKGQNIPTYENVDRKLEGSARVISQYALIP